MKTKNIVLKIKRINGDNHSRSRVYKIQVLVLVRWMSSAVGYSIEDFAEG
jgi:hypothetical protein